MQQYTDYIAQWRDREERMKQLFPYEAIEQPKQPIWMRSLEKHTNVKPNLPHTILGILVLAALVAVGVYFGR